MKPVISEFSYGFAVVNELLKRADFGFNAVPIFPSLYKEGQVNGGYDVFLGSTVLPLFLQFKLTDYMVRGTAGEVADGALRAPFFRMPIRSRAKSRQHEMLLDLESAGNAVFYVAPRFWSPDKFNDSFLASRILDDSVYVRPSDIGTVMDDGDHHVAFEPAADAGFFCSKPTKLNSGISFEAQYGHLRDEFKKHAFTLSVETAGRLLANMEKIIQGALWAETIQEIGPDIVEQKRPGLHVSQGGDQMPDMMEQLQFAARCYFGCDLLFLRQIGEN